jgi:hypothetical protein
MFNFPPPPPNPYAPPQSQVMKEPLAPVDLEYEGISRIGFVCSYVAIIILAVSISSVGGYAGAWSLILLLLMMLPVSSRLKNLGRNPAWCVLLLVPGVNLFVIVPCLLLPPGYQYHRRLDTAAKVIAGLLVAALVACLVMVFFELRKM